MSREQESTIVLALAAVAMLTAVVLMFALAAPMLVGPIISGRVVLVAAITFATALLLWMSVAPVEREEDRR
jgi:membrane protein implicated in regulation of membrane protease activity